MTRPPFSRILILALVGSAIILAGTIIGVLALWQPRSLDAFLPQPQTVALLENVTREDIRMFTAQYPALQAVPMYEGFMNVGVVTLPDARQGWVLSATEKDAPLPSSNLRIDRQDFLLSDPELQALLTSDEPRLRASQDFSLLTRSMRRDERWIFVKEPGSTVLPALLRSMIPESRALIVMTKGDTVTLRILGNTVVPGRRASAAIPLLTPTPDVTLALGNPKEILESRLQHLPEDERAVEIGMLTATVRQLLGGQWSYSYDLLPFLRQESVLHWRAATGTGGLAFLFQSSMDDVRSGKARLSELHERFRGSLLGTVVVDRPIEHGMRSTILKSDPSQAEDSVQNIRDWTVHTTRSGDQALMSATRGRDIVITNSREWLDQVTGIGHDLPLPSRLGSPVAGGSLSPALVDRVIGDSGGLPLWQWIRQQLEARNPVLWSIEADSDILTLNLANPPQTHYPAPR